MISIEPISLIILIDPCFKSNDNDDEITTQRIISPGMPLDTKNSFSYSLSSTSSHS